MTGERLLLIPDHNNWVVIMWHFSRDSLNTYKGEKFEVAWGNAKKVLTRVYTKKMKDRKYRVRIERQECPNKTLEDIVGEKLDE
jgi:hypothetical protein